MGIVATGWDGVDWVENKPQFIHRQKGGAGSILFPHYFTFRLGCSRFLSLGDALKSID
jgi:hypothetical protein